VTHHFLTIQKSLREKLPDPSVLQKSAMVAMSFLVVLSFMMSNLQALFWQSSDWLVGAVLPGVVAALTNTEREKYAVSPLSRSVVLDEAARMKAEHMAAEGYFAHYSPGGITPWYWFEQAGYVYAHAGENLAVYFQDSEEVVKAWMNSPTHKANVIGSQYTEIGIGTAKGKYQGFDTVFVVQLFGTPAKRPVVVSVVEEQASLPSTAPVKVSEEVNIEFPLMESEVLANAQSEEPVLIGEQEEVKISLVAGETVDSPASSTPSLTRVAEDNEVYQAEPALIVADAMAQTPHSFTATSSGLIPSLEEREFVAGTTAPVMSTLATKPRSVLQGVYMVLGSLIIILLISSIIIGYRTHKIQAIMVGVGLLVVMSLLFMWHIAITSGAIIL